MTIRNALEELLIIVEIHQRRTKNNFAWIEVEYAKELLAQPEQTEQAPVAWRWKTHKRNYYTYSEENYHELEGEPLYASPPKRELMGDGNTADGYRANKMATHPDSYWAGVNDAEKHHGIGER